MDSFPNVLKTYFLFRFAGYKKKALQDGDRIFNRTCFDRTLIIFDCLETKLWIVPRLKGLKFGQA